MPDGLKVFGGNSNPLLTKKICEYLGIEVGDITCKNFSDGEIYIKINENVRGEDVFLVHSTQPPADNLLELLLMIDAAKRASAERITAVIPYFGYARQDKKDEPRVPISAKLVADLLEVAGANRILTCDLHAEQIQGFFNIPVDHLYALPVFVDYVKKMNLSNFTLVSPDVGRVKRTWGFAKRIGGVPIAIVDKRRPAPNQSYVTNIVGEVKDRNIFIIDDIIDTGGTILGAVRALKSAGALDIYCFCTHSILSGNAKEKIESSEVIKLVTTDTIPVQWDSSKLTVLSVSKLLGEAVKRIHNRESVSSLFV
ncbi:ribose-phosphate pyrophosphokinase [candidate division WOR-3 bacterium JGI_Cruoil_03_44_89]|uniref:Ribose-phosphate pyrophosphokinase n=1 Tax=candidate division WOR-3 bacterium JGI_Cruoil_03_44_89 TaxID=1973748 RepID=A0A235BUE2_UNCW3|nr:MAG: ribose-phosphate pyrophosphokinase [candidate division WOR-3 bacterium JGI_Cruoil_03_44_89]